MSEIQARLNKQHFFHLQSLAQALQLLTAGKNHTDGFCNIRKIVYLI